MRCVVCNIANGREYRSVREVPFEMIVPSTVSLIKKFQKFRVFVLGPRQPNETGENPASRTSKSQIGIRLGQNITSVEAAHHEVNEWFRIQIVSAWWCMCLCMFCGFPIYARRNRHTFPIFILKSLKYFHSIFCGSYFRLEITFSVFFIYLFVYFFLFSGIFIFQINITLKWICCC